MEELVVLERLGSRDFLDCGVNRLLDHGGGSGQSFGEGFHVDRHFLTDFDSFSVNVVAEERSSWDRGGRRWRIEAEVWIEDQIVFFLLPTPPPRLIDFYFP